MSTTVFVAWAALLVPFFHWYLRSPPPNPTLGYAVAIWSLLVGVFMFASFPAVFVGQSIANSVFPGAVALGMSGFAASLAQMERMEDKSMLGSPYTTYSYLLWLFGSAIIFAVFGGYDGWPMMLSTGCVGWAVGYTWGYLCHS